MLSTMRYCKCCGIDKTVEGHFARDTSQPGGLTAICTDCEQLNASLVSKITRETCSKEQSVTSMRRADRHGYKRDLILARYAQHGKTCAACHLPKPAEEYNRSEARLDGLQANCRACDILRAQLIRQPFGNKVWQAARDALRVQAAIITAGKNS